MEIVDNPIGIYNSCLICKTDDLESILNLEEQPLANNFLREKKEGNKYPLHLFRCKGCSHTQINYIVDRSILFKNYIYESSTSLTSRKYFATIAERYTTVFSNIEKKNILDIACNDCCQLDEFKKRGWNTFGVDPAENLVIKGIQQGHIIEAKFWGTENVSFIQDVSFNLIIAQNVFAHVNNPIAFLQKCASIMSEDTLLVIQTSQANMYFNKEFDTIYHEHLSFFTIRSMMKAVELVDCYLDNVYKTDIHGTSYVFEIRKGNKVKNLLLLDEETEKGLYTDAIYKEYTCSILDLKKNALAILQKYHELGYTILGYGAAAKGMVFLNYIFNSSPNHLAPEIIIDNAKLKENLYTDGTLIPIKGIDILKQFDSKKIVFLILAWNFKGEIYSRLQTHIHENNLHIVGRTISFFPFFEERSL